MNILKAVKDFFVATVRFFKSGGAQKALQRAAELAPEVLPYIAIAADIAVGITPTTIDDAVLALIRAKYPALFDGSLKTPDEVKAFTLGVATELVKAEFPDVSTSIARLAVQAHYTAVSAGPVTEPKAA